MRKGDAEVSAIGKHDGDCSGVNKVNHSALKDRACSEVVSLQVPFG
jgi:hypothetical protein